MLRVKNCRIAAGWKWLRDGVGLWVADGGQGAEKGLSQSGEMLAVARVVGTVVMQIVAAFLFHQREVLMGGHEHKTASVGGAVVVVGRSAR